MNQNFVNKDGSRQKPAQIIADLQREEGVSLSSGCINSGSMQGNGYRYMAGHIDSFCQLYAASAITMTPGQYLSWDTLMPDFPETVIHPDAGNGAVILFEYAMGNGAAYPQSNGYFELSIDGKPAIRFSMKKSSFLFKNEQGIRLYLEVKRKKAVQVPGGQFSLDPFIQNESLYVNGTAYLYIPQRELAGRNNLALSVHAHNYEENSRRWFRLGFSWFLMHGEISSGLQAVLHGLKRPVLEGQPIFFGDIHVHTAQSGFLNDDGCGIGTVESNLAYARDVSGLDFCAVTDHDWQLDAHDWKVLRDTNERFNRDGQFTVLNAYEWTSSTYGHRNVYLRDGSEVPTGLKPFNYQAEPYGPIKYGISLPADPTPEDLWRWLDQNKLEAITIPHHPNSEQFLMDFGSFFNPKYDRCAEVYSSWGSFFAADHPLNLGSERIRGYAYKRYAGRIHFGFVASSDGHDGNAGDANVAKDKNHLSHYAGSGRVAVLARELTRAGVYDALKARHCYAVTGEPVLLAFHIGSAIMGDIIKPAAGLPLFVHAVGTFPITGLTLYKNGYAFRELPLNGQNDVSYTGILQDDLEAAYYVEVVQADGEYAWSSPIWCTRHSHTEFDS